MQRLAEAAVLRWCLVLHHSADDVTLDSGSLLPSIKQTAAHKVIFASKWYILFFLKRSRYLGNQVDKPHIAMVPASSELRCKERLLGGEAQKIGSSEDNTKIRRAERRLLAF